VGGCRPEGSRTIVQQLLQNGMPPHFGPPKTGRPRTLSLTAWTIELLRHHKAHQSELKLANRTAYRDYGLVFAREWRHATRSSHVLELPLKVLQATDRILYSTKGVLQGIPLSETCCPVYTSRLP
jgi:hypothetical protein